MRSRAKAASINSSGTAGPGTRPTRAWPRRGNPGTAWSGDSGGEETRRTAGPAPRRPVREIDHIGLGPPPGHLGQWEQGDPCRGLHPVGHHPRTDAAAMQLDANHGARAPAPGPRWDREPGNLKVLSMSPARRRPGQPARRVRRPMWTTGRGPT